MPYFYGIILAKKNCSNYGLLSFFFSSPSSLVCLNLFFLSYLFLDSFVHMIVTNCWRVGNWDYARITDNVTFAFVSWNEIITALQLPAKWPSQYCFI